MDDDTLLLVAQLLESETDQKLTFLLEKLLLGTHRPLVHQVVGNGLVLVPAHLVVQGKRLLLDLKEIVDPGYRALELPGYLLTVGIPSHLLGERTLGGVDLPSLVYLALGDSN